MKFRDDALITANYRFAFLQNMLHLAPNVFTELRSLAPIYSDVFGSLKKRRLCPKFRRLLFDDWFRIETPIEALVALTENPNIEDEMTASAERAGIAFIQLRDGLRRFTASDGYGLEQAWLKDALIDALADYSRRTDKCLHTTVYHSFPNRPVGRLAFELDRWDPVAKDSDEYLNERLAECKKVIMEDIEATADRFTGSTELRGCPNDLERTKWVVHWTVQEWTAAAIADEYFRTVGAVKKALKELKAFDLPVRAKTPGRPKSKKGIEKHPVPGLN